MASDVPAARITTAAEANAAPQVAASEGKMPYLPGLDGLRAIAVGAVLLYHAGMPWLPGGFLGVEVFFVISGYLITALLLSEWNKRDRINFAGFWLRRARRLLPALFLVLAATLAISVLFLPDEVARLRSDALAATGYVTNWYLIFSEQSYFEAVGRPSMLQHLWSLAVEEQFYLLWPLLFVAGMRFLKRRLLLLAAIGGAILSTVLMALLYVPDTDPSRIYYGTDTRAAGLLIGVALAFMWAPWEKRQESTPAKRIWAKSLALDLVGLAALGGIVAFFLYLDEFQPFLYQGGFAALGLVTAVAIAVTVHPMSRIGPKLLGLSVLRWVGLRSYGIYLWHWPVFMLTRPDLDVPFDGAPLFTLRIAATLVLAELSYRFVETPIRTGGLMRAWRAMRVAPGVSWGNLAARWTGAIAVLVAGVAIIVPVVKAQPPAPPSYLSGEWAEIITSEQTQPIEGASSQPGEALAPDQGQQSTNGSPATDAAQTSQGDPTPGSEAAQPEPPTAEPTATATSVPTATATPRPPDAVTNTGVNLRTGPGKAYPIVKVLAKGDTLTVLGKLSNASSYLVRTVDNFEGWAFAPALNLYIDPATVPVAQPGSVPQQSTPTPKPPTDPNAPGNTTSPPPDPAQNQGTQPTPAQSEPVQPTATPQPPPPAPPDPAPIPATPLRITAIGDSVMQGAAKELVRVLSQYGPVEVDAAKSRQVTAAIATLKSKRDAGKLGDVVIIHMGTNGTFSTKQFDLMMQVLVDVPRVIFVNVKVPRQWETANNRVIVEGVQKYPNTVLVDWKSAASGQPTLFAKDGIHLKVEGARLYTSLIAAQVRVP